MSEDILSQEKAELLALLLEEQGFDLAEPQIIPRRKQAESAVLSFSQQRFWFLDQLAPLNPALNIPVGLHVAGRLKVLALEQALNEIARRHESLRTTFRFVGGQPLQLISAPSYSPLRVTDLCGLPASERKTQAQQLMIEEANSGFDLDRGPLFRSSLLKLDEEEHILLITMHHIVSDGWSLGILVREIGALYEAYCRGLPSPLPELPIQYADFAEWQREQFDEKALETQLSYWKRQLSDSPAALNLPTDRPRPPILTFQGAIESRLMPEQLANSLKELSRQEGATLYMTMLAAFQVLLSRYSAQEDFVVGSPIANRNLLEMEGLIGVFINTLVMRGDLSGDPTFRELLARTREVTSSAYAYQDLPFEKLVEALQPERSKNRSELFQVMFMVQKAFMPPQQLSGLTITPLLVIDSRKGSMFDLTMFIVERAEGTRNAIEYNSDLFDAATIVRMLGNYERLLAGIAADPDRPISELPLLAESERRQLLVEWNSTHKAYPRDKCLHQLFEAQAELTPEAVAVIFEEKQLTYGELNRRANQLANYLLKRGVGPDVLVAICMERSVEMVVGLLGILKSGGAYVPLDPAYPQQRLSFMLEDATVSVLLTEERLLNGLPACSAEVVCLDTDREVIAREREQNPISRATAENLAYVLYTSGSTGRPKGVAIEHHSTVALLDWAGRLFTPAQLAGVLASTSICFDLSVFELFVPLSCGGKIILARNALHLPTLLAAKDVTLINTVPSAIAELVKVGGVPASVSTVNLAGEPLQHNLVEQVYQLSTVKQIYNLYGPTEDTTYSTYAAVRNEDSKSPTVGRPISNTQVYVLDPHLQPVPIGVGGELHIGGDGLARGYLNRPELTAERFIANPFSTREGARLYKTGDLACYLPDGSIEFLGRRDNQVKIRGFRIELEEVEATLAKHPTVRDCVVVAREDVAGDKRLVAYVVSNQENLPGRNELRDFLKEKLPEHMVPSAFVRLESLPLTANGKIDRQALPGPELAPPDLEYTFVPPRDELELRLTQMWEKILNLRPVGVTDDFFDRGGNSLLAVSLVFEIQKVYGKRIPLSNLFQGATIEHLASMLRQKVGLCASPTLIEIQAGGTKRPFFWVAAPNINALGYIPFARYLGSDQPVFGLQSQYQEQVEYSQEEVEALAGDYLEAMKRGQAEGPYLLGGMCAGALIAFEMARRLEAQGQKVAVLALFDTWDTANTLTHLWYLNYYLGRLGSLVRQSPAEQLRFALKKARGVAEKIAKSFRFGAARPQASPSRVSPRDIYWPGRDYVPRIYHGRVTLFRVRKQRYYRINDPEFGWGKRAAGGVDVHIVPGEHDTMFREPNVQVLTQKLSDCIRQAE